MNAPMHEGAYRLRRILNWVPLGLTYAFFYMGRYNLTVAKTAFGDAMTKDDFGTIFAVGAWVYGISFLFTGPLTDRIGGRRSMLIGTMGVILSNVLMGLVLYGQMYWNWSISLFPAFVVLYALNMHFQSFGAIAIVTVNAPWFHVRERGTFSTIFGIMISLGLYFAFDWGTALVEATRATPTKPGLWTSLFATLFGLGGTGVDQNWWIFFAPAIFLTGCWIVMSLYLRDTPGQAGYPDFETGSGSVTANGERLPVSQVFFKLLSHPVLLVICGIEFCSGVLRNGIMHWYPIYAAELGFKKTFWITGNWGLVMLLAGVGGAFLTGWASDRFFQSRRAPMAAILYGAMLVSFLIIAGTLGSANLWIMGIGAFAVSLCVIGVHGIMSGTSTADFGGKKNVGAAVGIVDGMVYLGTGVQSLVIGKITPVGAAAKDATNWIWWPVFLAPFALVGLVLAARIWNALPKKAHAPAPEPAPALTTAATAPDRAN